MNRFPNDADGDALARIAAGGVDMTKPLTIEVAIHAPSQSAADAIKSAVINAGYAANIEFDEGEPHDESDPEEVEEFGPAWTVYTQIAMVPAYDEVIRIQAELDAVAKPYNGYTDGWGTLVDPGGA